MVLTKLLLRPGAWLQSAMGSWVPALVNKLRHARVLTQCGPRQDSAILGQVCLPQTASCSLKVKLLGLNRSDWVSMDTCLKTDILHLNSNRWRMGNRGVAQGEKIIERLTLLKHLSNTTLERERLGSGVILQVMPDAYQETRVLLAFFEALRFCSHTVKHCIFHFRTNCPCKYSFLDENKRLTPRRDVPSYPKVPHNARSSRNPTMRLPS